MLHPLPCSKVRSAGAIVAASFLFAVLSPLPAHAIECNSNHHLMQSEGGEKVDLKVDGTCYVTDTIKPGDQSLIYVFHNVNVVSGGMLIFVDGQNIDFYAESILIEYKGLLQAGTQSQAGAFKSRLTFHLWGPEDDPGIQCQSPLGSQGAPCGIPDPLWTANTAMSMHMNMQVPTAPTPPKNAPCTPSDSSKYGQYLPKGDCFYQYEIMDAADKAANRPAYFGHKVLAVSFGGSLQLFGSEGTTYLNGNCDPTDPNNECSPANTGSSWRRLTNIDGKTLTLNRPQNPVQWKAGDHVVVTTTDYLPRHSEEMVLDKDATSDNKIVLTATLMFPHNANLYPLPANLPAGIGPANDPNVPEINRAIDTRAAVALLSRNIQIVSAGEKPMEPLTGYFGGHTIIRQGFEKYQVQGVEFYQLGQGGVVGRYPVHFHMDRLTPQQTDPTQGALNFLKDCSIHDSMTRWVTIHATQGMYLARNVGYLSIGHGFFFEDATEINNKLYANIGIMARAAIQNDQNSRQVPGILADTSTDNLDTDHMPYRSDFNHPTVFWIMNGWNDFEYNMAAGAGTCGACYWWLPGAVSGPSQYEHWDGYASQQIWDPLGSEKVLGNRARAGLTPMKTFVGNSCVAAMSSFQSVGNTNQCFGVYAQGSGGLAAVSSEAPRQPADPNRFDIYYPTINDLRNPTVCAGADDPNNTVQCGATKGVTANPCDVSTGTNCAATVLNHYTTSYNWAQTNFSAVWLRPRWFLVDNSAVTDVQTGGINFVTGGGYTRSDVPIGFWSVLKNTALVGHTQSQGLGGSFFALDSGPFNPLTNRIYGLKCDNTDPNSCQSAQEGVTFILPPFPGQRLFNIYDGPAFQQNNVYLDTTTTYISDCQVDGNGNCGGSQFPLARNIGVLKDVVSKTCYLPNAAIAWKQPNGFYYPPSFYSRNLWFKNVDIRHFVVEPFFTFDPQSPDDPFVQDQAAITTRYCTYNAPIDGYGTTFNGFNHIDRETVLNDADGTLTGLLAQDDNDPVNKTKPTISINEDPFFNGPEITPECLSDKGVTPYNPDDRVYTARTSPYEWLTTAMSADCAIQKGPYNNLLQCQDDQNHVRWANSCTDPSCRGVPLYREDLTDEEKGTQPSIRMMGQNAAQRSTLSLNHGSYYIDTTQTCDSQGACPVCTLNPQGTDCRYCKPGTNDCWANPIDTDPNPWHPTVFLKSQTYYVFLLYAKPSTKQTYDIYVGKKEEGNYQIEPVRANLPDLHYDFTPKPTGDWLKPPPVYNASTGTVRVTIDLSGHQSDFDKSRVAFCQPRSFCQPMGSGASATCVCKPGTSCTDDSVCAWALNDLDCPQDPDDSNKMGCFGFSITMPNDFDPQSPIKPDDTLFKPFGVNDSYFNEVGFNTKVQSSGADCKYPPQ